MKLFFPMHIFEDEDENKADNIYIESRTWSNKKK